MPSSSLFTRILKKLAPPVPPDSAELNRRIEYLEEVVRYLDFQVANQASLLRHLAGPVIQDLPEVRATRASFDFQWAELPTGRYMLENEQFRAEAPGYVQEFTGLPASWFPGKTVLDAGCGLGRYSWALCQLGARVTSIDQSDHGLRRTTDACGTFPAIEQSRSISSRSCRSASSSISCGRSACCITRATRIEPFDTWRSGSSQAATST